MAKNHSKPNAFTLVELLVVIAIISVLAALLLPALEGAMKQARLTACSNQLKQIGTGASQYDMDFGIFGINMPGGQAYGPKLYPQTGTPLCEEFQYYAREYLGAPKMVSIVWVKGGHGIFECPSKDIPRISRVYDMSYLYASVVNEWYGIKSNNRTYQVTTAVQKECERVYGYLGRGLGIKLASAEYASALPLFFDVCIYSPGTMSKEYSNHESRLNAVYIDGSVATQMADPEWRGAYMAQANITDWACWYFAYVRNGTFPQ